MDKPILTLEQYFELKKYLILSAKESIERGQFNQSYFEKNIDRVIKEFFTQKKEM